MSGEAALKVSVYFPAYLSHPSEFLSGSYKKTRKNNSKIACLKKKEKKIITKVDNTVPS